MTIPNVQTNKRTGLLFTDNKMNECISRRENSMESSVTSNDSGASSGSEGGTGEGIRKITAKERYGRSDGVWY